MYGSFDAQYDAVVGSGEDFIMSVTLYTVDSELLVSELIGTFA